MPTPYPVKFKLPLEFLTLQDWNNFVQNLLFINQYGPGKLLQYYQNGNFQNLDEVIANYLYVSALKVAGYNVLHNLSQPQAYTFGEGNQQPFKTMSQRPTVNFPYSIPIKFVEFYPITKLPSYQFLVFPVEKLKVQLSAVSKQLQLLIPKLISKITVPHFIAGTQFQFSGTATVQTLIENYLDPRYLQTWREITIQNLGSSAVQINNSIYLMPKQYLKITASSPSEIQLTAQTPTLLSEEIEFVGTPITTYTITITNSQSDPTPSPFQQLLNLNLSSLLSSSSQLLNLEFCLDAQCNTPLYAWIQGNSLSNAYIWIKLPISIPANSSITIYMFVRNSIQYPYTGIAPNLTSTYGQYDNGQNVFLNYFSGTSLSGWTVSGSASQTNSAPSGNSIFGTYAFYANSANGDYLYTIASGQSENMIIEYYVYTQALNDLFFLVNSGGAGQMIRTGNGSGWYGIASTSSWTSWSAPPDTGSWSNEWVTVGVVIQNGVATGYLSTGVNIYGSEIGSNPSNQYTVTDNGDYLGLVGDAWGSSYISYWNGIIIRALPPNNVMPSNSQPQKTIVLI